MAGVRKSMTLSKTEAIGKIIHLAKNLDINETIDYSFLDLDLDEAYEMIAHNVLTQMYETPEDYRESVQLASLTKVLVENLQMKAKIQRYEKATAK